MLQSMEYTIFGANHFSSYFAQHIVFSRISDLNFSLLTTTQLSAPRSELNHCGARIVGWWSILAPAPIFSAVGQREMVVIL